MRLRLDQLEANLNKQLQAIYLICGDEPLQLGEAADQIRKAAKQAGFDNREILTVDTHFDWRELSAAAEAMSIFSEKKLIDLRLPNGKPGMEGSKAFLHYCERRPEDTILLITSGKLEASASKSKWVQAIEATGILVQVWPLAGKELMNWLSQRLQQKGMSADSDGLKILVTRIEGNLLAAAQEIEKLFVLYGPVKLKNEDIASVVADSSRYDVFNLADALLAGNAERIVKILEGLEAEGVAAPIVLWSITREIRVLCKIKQSLRDGHSKDQAFSKNQVWDKRKPLIDAAIHRLNTNRLDQALLLSAKADRQIKGAQMGDPWHTLLTICLLMAGLDPMGETG